MAVPNIYVYCHLSNIQEKLFVTSRFSSQDTVTAFSIFDPKKVPSSDSHDVKLYGESAIHTLLSQFGILKPSKGLDGVEYNQEPIISDEVIIEWKNFRRFIAQYPKESLGAQLQELATNDMLGAMYPNLKLLAIICMTVPVTTASVE